MFLNPEICFKSFEDVVRNELAFMQYAPIIFESIV